MKFNHIGGDPRKKKNQEDSDDSQEISRTQKIN